MTSIMILRKAVGAILVAIGLRIAGYSTEQVKQIATTLPSPEDLAAVNYE